MFNYVELLSKRLKKRDFELWAWKAQKALVEKEMRLANLMRISQSSQSSYGEFFNERKSDLLRLDGKLKDLHKEHWADLRAKKRG